MYSIYGVSKFIKTSSLVLICISCLQLQIRSYYTGFWSHSFLVGFSQEDKCRSNSMYRVMKESIYITSTLSVTAPLVHRSSRTIHGKDLCFDDDGISKLANFLSTLDMSITVDQISEFEPKSELFFLYGPWIILLSTISLLAVYLFEKKRGYMQGFQDIHLARGNHVICGSVIILLIVSAIEFETSFDEDCHSLFNINSVLPYRNVSVFCGGLDDSGAVFKSVPHTNEFLVVYYSPVVYTLSCMLLASTACQFFVQDLCYCADRNVYPDDQNDVEFADLDQYIENDTSLLEELRVAATLAVETRPTNNRIELLAANWKKIPTHVICHLDNYSGLCSICLTPLFPSSLFEKSEKKCGKGRLGLDASEVSNSLKSIQSVMKAKYAVSSRRDVMKDQYCNEVNYDITVSDEIYEDAHDKGDDRETTDLLQGETALSSQSNSRDSRRSSFSSRKSTGSRRSSNSSTSNISRSISVVDLIPGFLRRPISTVEFGNTSPGSGNSETKNVKTPVVKNYSNNSSGSNSGNVSNKEKDSPRSNEKGSGSGKGKDSGSSREKDSNSGKGKDSGSGSVEKSGSSASTGVSGGGVGVILSNMPRRFLKTDTNETISISNIKMDSNRSSAVSTNLSANLSPTLSPTLSPLLSPLTSGQSLTSGQTVIIGDNLQSMPSSTVYTPTRSISSEVTVVEVPCGHVFHKPCLLEWTTLHTTCPICRAALDTGAVADILVG